MAEFKEVKNVEVKDSDFRLVQVDKKIHDTKFDTKPTTFLKDALKRFTKNKSSVAGAFILGLLILLAIFVPMVSTLNIEDQNSVEHFLAPKLFEAGTGFWDGTREYTNIVYDRNNEVPADFYKPAVLELVLTEEKLEDYASKYGIGGYVMFVNEQSTAEFKDMNKPIALNSPAFTLTSDGNYAVTYVLKNKEDVYGNKLGQYTVYLTYKNQDAAEKKIVLKGISKDYSAITLNLSDALANENDTLATNAKVVFELKGIDGNYSYLLFESCVFTADSAATNLDLLAQMSFTDATEMVLRENSNVMSYWSCSGRKGVHESKVQYCDFTYDTYAVVYDEKYGVVTRTEIENYRKNGWCTYDEKDVINTFKVLSDECPLKEVKYVDYNVVTKKILSVEGIISRYQKMGYKNMPKFIFGTDANGHDVFKKAFAGLRTSLILGVCTFAFCFLFGLCWGAISGYFGGNVDLFMERFCDILGGIPSTVVLTLAILHLGNNFGTFVMALCLTGWMGTAARTRTQFYRFKGREYVLASRTLGSSDMRLIFKHILPNSLGTIITSSVLMIPSVIFSEASLAYLNLGLQGLHSFGVLLSDNQQYLGKYPNLVVFPAAIIALIMISFNLFGNGLRDALNPSLKGSE